MMKNTIGIIDYGMGNIQSIVNAFECLGVNARPVSSPRLLTDCSGYILPGVGAFGKAMANLNVSEMVPVLETQVFAKKKPILGICLGMHLMATSSEEKGFSEGLGWFDGQVVRLPDNQARVPNVGWAEVSESSDGCFNVVQGKRSFYFDHSYYLKCGEEYVIAKSVEPLSFVAAVRKENVVATQFHPEKSQQAGLSFLESFLRFYDLK